MNMNINLTASAREEILKQNKENKDVRIYVASMGWAGPSFSLSLEEATDTDVVKELDGVRFIVDKDLDERFDGVKVDYGTMFFRKGFIIGLENGGGGSCS